MLVLTRFTNETIVINPGTPDEIVVSVVETRRGKVRLGFTCGQHIKVWRSELLEEISHAEGKAPKA